MESQNDVLEGWGRRSGLIITTFCLSVGTFSTNDETNCRGRKKNFPNGVPKQRFGGLWSAIRTHNHDLLLIGGHIFYKRRNILPRSKKTSPNGVSKTRFGGPKTQLFRPQNLKVAISFNRKAVEQF